MARAAPVTPELQPVRAVGQIDESAVVTSTLFVWMATLQRSAPSTLRQRFSVFAVTAG